MSDQTVLFEVVGSVAVLTIDRPAVRNAVDGPTSAQLADAFRRFNADNELRVAATDAVFGIYCRRWGVPLIDGGTVGLSRLIGHSHALDLILTGRGVSGDEAFRMGLANRLCEPGQALAASIELAELIAGFPQGCMRSDRRSSHERWGLGLTEAMSNETALGLAVMRSGETREGAARFAAGAGRHGAGSPHL